tara:strand:- start:1420 stop:1722 length:303 start_codon:yes stop_codon:yes gene_type:complete
MAENDIFGSIFGREMSFAEHLRFVYMLSLVWFMIYTIISLFTTGFQVGSLVIFGLIPLLWASLISLLKGDFLDVAFDIIDEFGTLLLLVSVGVLLVEAGI